MGHFEDRAVQYMVKLIADFGLQDFQAAAIPGNFGTESGGFTQTQEIHPTAGRGGLGDGQWTGPRRRDFEAWLARNADKDWQPDTFDANYSQLYREIYEEGPERAALVALRKTTTLEQATESFMNHYERPGVPNLSNRISWARKALAAFHAAGSPVAPKPQPAQQVLPPLPKIDPNTLAPLINAALPILLQLLAQRQQGATGGQPGQGIDLAGMLGQLIGGPAPQPVILPAPPKPPESAAVATKPGSSPLTHLFNILLSAGTATAMSADKLGTPFGFGTDPTTSGSLAAIASIASIAVGFIPGGYGAIASAALDIVKRGAKRLAA